MNCQQCGAEAAPGAGFCLDCGARLEMRCQACQTPYTPGSRFCGHCGHNLADAGPETSGATPGSGISEGQPEPAQPYQPLQPAQQVQPEPEPQPGICPRCHQVNAPGASQCFTCGMPFDVATAAVPSGATLRAFALGAPGGFWLRSLAYIIDALVIVLPLFVLWMLMGQPIPASTDEILEPPPGYERLQLLVLLLTLIYDTALITLWATTVGKRAFGLYVVRSDGSRVGPGRALARHLLTALSANFTLGFIFLVVAFRRDRRGLHDLICDTVVIQRRRQP